MKRRAYILVLIAALFMVLSCSKDKEENPYQFSNSHEFEEFINKHDWVLTAWTFDEYERDMDNQDKMLIWFGADYRGGDLNPSDTFSLSINGINVPYNQELLDEFGKLEFYTVEIPIASKIDLLFKRNNSVIFDKSARPTATPKFTSFPIDLNWSEDITVKWSLAKNSHVQLLDAKTFNDDDSKYVIYFLNPSALSYKIPANELYLPNIIGYYMNLVQLNLTEYNNTVLVSMKTDGRDTYSDTERDPRKPGNILERILSRGRVNR